MIRPHSTGMGPDVCRSGFIDFDNADIVAIARCIFHIKCIDFMPESTDDLGDAQTSEGPHWVADMSNVLMPRHISWLGDTGNVVFRHGVSSSIEGFLKSPRSIVCLKSTTFLYVDSNANNADGIPH